MKLYLFLNDKILTFKLPLNVSGSYSFDENDAADEKLINIESRDGVWVLYSSGDVQIMVNGTIVQDTPLQNNCFYQIKRGNTNYLLYTESNFLSQILTYTYDKTLNLMVGNGANCNVKYNLGLIKDLSFHISFEQENIVLDNKGTVKVYINNSSIPTGKYYLKYGDVINLYGFKIMILKNYMLLNNIQGLTQVDGSTNLKQHNFNAPSQLEMIEIKDRDLYSKDDYFSKAPRIRRLIETKQIELSSPPKPEHNNEMPLLLTIGPMLTMGLTSAITLVSMLSQIYKGTTTWAQSWSSILIAVAMLASMLLWPLITNMYNKKQKARIERETKEKYIKYLEGKKIELAEETNIQKNILNENLITTSECLKIIKNKTVNFWDKRIDQSDFLVTRIGVGNQLLDVDIKYPEKGFSIDEDELRKRVDEMAAQYEYIINVPLGYSFYENRITAIMGLEKKVKAFVDNILLQLLSFYSYDDLKIVIFTNDKNKEKWNYVKYLNHNFSNDKNIRFFSTNQESSKLLCNYLLSELSYRKDINEQSDIRKPYYLIITDDYEQIKRDDFITELCELNNNPGFSFIIMENRLSNLPSKCNNFINIGDVSSSVLKNSFEKQQKIDFKDEVITGIDMMEISKILSNVPIELDEEINGLPDSITFVEMEKIGKVKQLNILSRWNSNQATTSLKAEVGVDEFGELMYLDLHEKAHGPHGLIAGMTGSGKSEFIITYILSMAVNYSPDDVAFILIDYKGGGLAFAFENQTTGISLPHLAGTITNLDKAEMERMLTSIDSEVKRRQKMFNEARENLGESTIDIYKYQKFYKEGRLAEPIPHLFIVCDEFAELKDQQPEFMDNLISIARIGRSLGIHLILATQKPSGVVNDQIWSNAKFHVCLKVQDANDSNEMLKRPDAANLKQTGRFYLQVGYDEYFALGQSAWCGAKYYPSDTAIKTVDKKINFINDIGYIIKSVQASSNKKIEDMGDQLSAIMASIVEVSNETGKKAKKLWLENIPDKILVDALVNKYNLAYTPTEIKAIIGEYDAPEFQQQNILTYDILKQGNTAIYSMDGSEAEMLLESIIYSTITKYHSSILNYYIVDYGSQVLKRYEKAPHVGGVVLNGDDEKYSNLFKLLKKEIKQRKKILSDFGGDFENYQKQNPGKLPLKVIILNNYDSIDESDKKLFEELPEIIRDSERYGFVFIITATGVSSIPRKVTQSINSTYALKLKDPMDYSSIFTSKKKLVPRDIFGRGMYQEDELLHEFQTASIVLEKNNLTNYINDVIVKLNQLNWPKARVIPTLPERVTFDTIQNEVKDLMNIPVGINKNSLDIETYNFTNYLGTIITANKLKYTKNFILSFMDILSSNTQTSIVVFDPLKELSNSGVSQINYCNNNFNEFLEKINHWLEEKTESNNNSSTYIIIYGLSKFLDMLENTDNLENMFKLCKKINNTAIVLLDDVNKFKNYIYEDWFQSNVSLNDGIFIGKGVGEQTILKIANYHAELSSEYPNNIAFKIEEGSYEIFKTIDFERNDN